MRSQRLLACSLSTLLCLAGCGGGNSSGGRLPAQSTPVSATEAYCGSDYLEIEERIDSLLGELSLEEATSLMHGSTFLPTESGYLASSLPERGIPGFLMVDGPRGLSQLTDLPATAFPVGMARAATWDPELERRVGRAMGLETRAAGASVILAPTINILTHPRWGRAQETYGEDPYLMGSMGVAFVEGVQENALASAKHFAANNIENTRFEVDVTIDERTLREIYLPHFRRVVQEARVASVMTAYNSVNGAFASENDHLLGDILKGEWEFQGFVESDWVFGMHSSVAAAEAGLDIEMPAPRFYGEPLVEAVEGGELSRDVVDRAVRRILRAQFCFGLDTNPPQREPAKIATSEHTGLAREVARRSIVLLKNDGALPIDRSTTTGIVVLGELADAENIGDNGSSNVLPAYVVTALEGIVAAADGRVLITHIPATELSMAEASQVAAADYALVVTGLTAEDEGESLISAGDREGLGLAPKQDALIAQVAATGTPTVVVLQGGSAITMGPWLDAVDAVLMAWYPGIEGGNAIADILFGEESPSGRLPISFPVAEADLPPFDNVSESVTYSYFHGYRHLQNQGSEPLFPFGFGLSYTSFEYSNLELSSTEVAAGDTITITLDVENTGNREAIETVQLYAGALSSAVPRAPRELEAFTQVKLAAGVKESISFDLPISDLAFYDVESMAWVVEPTAYRVELGSSSGDLPLSAIITVEGP